MAEGRLLDYDWTDYESLPWSERFPQWVEGSRYWAEQARLCESWQLRRWESFVLEELFPKLRELGDGTRESTRPPRVFISHRQTDALEAKRVATIAKSEGFAYWLDVEDPLLRRLATMRTKGTRAFRLVALTTAIVIEMALLNSTHIVAVMTRHTRGSQWVPYEYGRVKERTPYSHVVGAWITPVKGKIVWPEYLHLGRRFHSEHALRIWLKSELKLRSARSFNRRL